MIVNFSSGLSSKSFISECHESCVTICKSSEVKGKIININYSHCFDERRITGDTEASRSTY